MVDSAVGDMMSDIQIPKLITNWINGIQCNALGGKWLSKFSPVTGQEIYQLARSEQEDIAAAVSTAIAAQSGWADMPAVQRGMILHEIVKGLQSHREEMAQVVAAETGKSLKEARGETEGAIQQGLFMAGEGQRLYGRTTTSGVSNKHAMTVRQPVGVAGLIIAANTPIANVAWKVFPALICGNAVVLKAAEDTPATAWLFGAIAKQAGLPDGVLNIVQGSGLEAGAPLVEHEKVGVVSFTGSTKVGREIAVKIGHRLGRVSLELGGKNPLVVCDDADLENAARWVCLSAFSNAGQRCASGSRIIIFDAIYEQFREMLIEHTRALKVGSGDEHDLGPVINESQLNCMLAAVEEARSNGASVLIGGQRLNGEEHKAGYYMAPTLVEAVAPEDAMSSTELFGPITTLYRVKDFNEALELANHSPYGLTACIHTRNFNRAMEFSYRVQAGATVVNGGTYGSEPHMPFGGFKQSGNGTREPGTEALDVYSELKDIYLLVDPAQV
jgi:acyl-CoA reductase-like NAD-dependent aldehyde dehydrogenase